MHLDPRVVRLTPDKLSQLPATVAIPHYDRRRLKIGIVHLGIGAFMRAHLSAMTEAYINQRSIVHPSVANADADSADEALRWGIIGVSLRQSDTRDALSPQDGLYTLAVRGAREDEPLQQSLQVIGCVKNVLLAPDDPEAVLALIAHADTRIVSLTITEKGYCHSPVTGSLQFDHPDIAHDLSHPEQPRSAIGFIVHGLRRRKKAAVGPISLMSLDNLPSNGHLLKHLTLSFARRIDAELAQWIEQCCCFPNSMVDRIVPRTTAQDVACVSECLQHSDQWPVVAEPFLDWAIEDDFVAGRPDWTVGGARFVASAAPWETLKLRMVNGAHSCIAYLGSVAGWQTVDVAIREDDMRHLVESLMRTEIEPTLPDLPGLDFALYRRRLIERFANPALAHRTQQIAMDGSQKIMQRWLGTISDRLAQNKSVWLLSLCLASWIRYLQGHDEAGVGYDINDPLATALSQIVHSGGEMNTIAAITLAHCRKRVESLLRFEPVFGRTFDGYQDTLIDSTSLHLFRLNSIGVVETIRSALREQIEGL